MAHQGTAHKYSKRLIAFEHAPPSTLEGVPNTLLWIGGLGDGLLTVPYPTAVAAALPSLTEPWVIAEVLLSSSYKGWGTGSLARDARELGQCVAYFNKLRPGKKVVLMGHSTGCQDIMEYLVGPGKEERPAINGAILQGGVSDREAWADMMQLQAQKDAYASVISTAKAMIDKDREKDIMPRDGNIVMKELGAPMSAYRTYALLAPLGDDDYFSSDLPDSILKETFGKIPSSTPLCFLLGTEDPYVPATVDKAALLQRWTQMVRMGRGVVDDVHGGLIEGGHHNFDGDPASVVDDLVKRVCGFLEWLDEDEESIDERVRNAVMEFF